MTWFACVMEPGVDRIGVGMVFDIEYLHDPVPICLPAENSLTGTLSRCLASTQWSSRTTTLSLSIWLMLWSPSSLLRSSSYQPHRCHGWSGVERIVVYRSLTKNSFTVTARLKHLNLSNLTYDYLVRGVFYPIDIFVYRDPQARFGRSRNGSFDRFRCIDSQDVAS